MRTLYFDIDGTLLDEEARTPKPALAKGNLEAAVRRAQVERLVCVGTFCGLVRKIRTAEPDFDGLGSVFSLCQGVFADEAWFRSTALLIDDPANRASAIDRSGDWWYVDNLAERFFAMANLDTEYRRHRGVRICTPDPTGSGEDVLHWIERIPR